MIVGWIAKIVAGLYSNRRPGEVSAAVATAVLLTFIPGSNLLWFGLLAGMFLLRINHAVALVFIAVLAPVSSVADPLLHRIGHAVLTAPALHNLFSSLYNIPLVPFTRFNNTLVMGGLIAGLVLWVPLFLVGRIVVMLVRTHIVPALAASRPVRAVTKVPLVSRLVGATRHWLEVYQALR